MGKAENRKNPKRQVEIKPFQKGGKIYHSKLNLIFFASLFVLLSALAYFRSGIWKDELILWEDVVEKSPEKEKAHNNLGNAYYDRARLDEAIMEYLIASKLNPSYWVTHNNLGNTYYKQGNLNESIKKYMDTLKLNPNYAKSHYNLGNIYLEQTLHLPRISGHTERLVV